MSSQERKQRIYLLKQEFQNLLILEEVKQYLSKIQQLLQELQVLVQFLQILV